ncbi:hypothetical protein [Methylocystis sp. L43]|jgi:hypothetical protein|uniref:hypothetical protein n=1 Tax=unclassified Methylocystis TaxID=2625913 RepID=UPI0032B17F71
MQISMASLFAAIVLACAPALAAERVTVDNFKPAETDYYMQSRADAGCFAKLCGERGPMPVDKQAVIRLNRDTPYSSGVFDLTSPVTRERWEDAVHADRRRRAGRGLLVGHRLQRQRIL